MYILVVHHRSIDSSLHPRPGMARKPLPDHYGVLEIHEAPGPQDG